MKQHKLENLGRALASLDKALILPIGVERDLGGIIKAFECAYELSWTVLKIHLQEQGSLTQGPKDVFQVAWRLGLLPGHDELWFSMIKDRNLTVHTYDAQFAQLMVERIRRDYQQALHQLFAALKSWHPPL